MLQAATGFENNAVGVNERSDLIKLGNSLNSCLVVQWVLVSCTAISSVSLETSMPIFVSGDGEDTISFLLSPLPFALPHPGLRIRAQKAHATVRVPAENRRGELALPRFHEPSPNRSTTPRCLICNAVYHLHGDTSPNTKRVLMARHSWMPDSLLLLEKISNTIHEHLHG